MIPERLRFLVEPGSPAVELARRFEAAGHQLFLVGGSVRDAFLGRPHQDLDFATDARPDQVKRVVDGWADAIYTVGEIYGTVTVLHRQRSFEITTFRSEVYREESRKPRVDFSSDIETDLSRRDFTVNAVAIRLPEVEPVDPFGGLADLQVGVLRTPLEPERSFADDPLRMLRLYRFSATLGFNADASVEAAVSAMAGRLSIVSSERIRDELSKLLLGEHAGEALGRVVVSGLAAHFFPELPALALEQDPVHRHKDVLAHTLAVVDKVSPRLELRLAALFHDIGKPATRSYGAGGVSFHHHEVVGARMTRDRLRALRYARQVVDDVARLVFLHLRPHTLKMGWTDSAVRRYVRDAGHLLADLNELVRCDVTTANARRATEIEARIDELEWRIEELTQREELAAIRPPINGHQVMAYLGIKPGPAVGEILDLLLERRIDQGPYSEAEAYAEVRRWAIDHGMPDPGGRQE